MKIYLLALIPWKCSEINIYFSLVISLQLLINIDQPIMKLTCNKVTGKEFTSINRMFNEYPTIILLITKFTVICLFLAKQCFHW